MDISQASYSKLPVFSNFNTLKDVGSILKGAPFYRIWLSERRISPKHKMYTSHIK